MHQFHRPLLIVSTLLASWLGMQAIHELGHVLGAWATAARVERVVLHPLTISRTDLGENPQPLTVVWAGPIVGVLLPIAIWGAAATCRMPGAFVPRFFAGFCLIANGLYLGIGSFFRTGDCGEMLRHGSAAWQLWLFGILTTPLGLWLWNGQGKKFGLGPDAETETPWIAYATLFMLLILVGIGVCLPGP